MNRFQKELLEWIENIINMDKRYYYTLWDNGYYTALFRIRDKIHELINKKKQHRSRKKVRLIQKKALLN